MSDPITDLVDVGRDELRAEIDRRMFAAVLAAAEADDAADTARILDGADPLGYNRAFEERWAAMLASAAGRRRRREARRATDHARARAKRKRKQAQASKRRNRA